MHAKLYRFLSLSIVDDIDIFTCKDRYLFT